MKFRLATNTYQYNPMYTYNQHIFEYWKLIGVYWVALKCPHEYVSMTQTLALFMTGKIQYSFLRICNRYVRRHISDSKRIKVHKNTYFPAEQIELVWYVCFLNAQSSTRFLNQFNNLLFVVTILCVLPNECHSRYTGIFLKKVS